MALEPGRRAWLSYGFGEWHERLVLSWIDGRDHMVASPDLEIFKEQLDSGNPDLDGFRLGPAFGGMLVGVPGPNEILYAFQNLMLIHENALIAEGKELAQRERRARGLVGLGAAPLAGGLAAALPVPAAGFPGVGPLPIAAGLQLQVRPWPRR